MDNDIIKLRVKDILREQGLTQKDLAEKMCKTPQYIGNVLNAKQGISINVLGEIARALDVEFKDLFATTRNTPDPTPVCPHCGKPIAFKTEIVKK